jgi:23S rRNA pseudouridine1911/1915/1917 synthase
MNTLNDTLIIPAEQAGQRIDQALAQHLPEYSRARIQAWLKDGAILCEGEPVQTKYRLKGGETITLSLHFEEQTSWKAQDLALNVVYCDEDIIVLAKPAGVIVHPGAGNPDGTLVNALLHVYPELALLPRGGIVHRLDKDTSGLMVVARSILAHQSLVNQLQNRTVKRHYEAIVHGSPISGGQLEFPIGRDPRMRQRMAVTESGKFAKTHYRIQQRFLRQTWIKCRLETGRTHQIRVHMAHIKYPLVGDPLYGRRRAPVQGLNQAQQDALNQFPRQALHAAYLEVIHPRTQEKMRWEAPLPQDMQDLIDILVMKED